MNDVTFNQPTLALLGAAWLVLSGVIWTLFQLVRGRMERAESQVDTLIPMARDMVVELKAIRGEMNTEFKTVCDGLARLRDERPYRGRGEIGRTGANDG